MASLHAMLIYTLKRLLYVTPVVIGVSIICFLLVHIAPGDPLSAILPADATQELVDQMRAAYGFDKPLPVQYALWFWKVLHGDLGTSIATGRSVASEVMRAVGNTLILATVATAIGFTFGTFFGFVAGYFRGSWLDKLASLVSVLGVTSPLRLRSPPNWCAATSDAESHDPHPDPRNGCRCRPNYLEHNHRRCSKVAGIGTHL
jgi:peptide/nickel transport system permease protein